MSTSKLEFGVRPSPLNRNGSRFDSTHSGVAVSVAAWAPTGAAIASAPRVTRTVTKRFIVQPSSGIGGPSMPGRYPMGRNYPPRGTAVKSSFDETHLERSGRELAGAAQEAQDPGHVGLRLRDGGDAAARGDRGGAGVVGGERERDRGEAGQQVVHKVGLR